MQAGERIGGRSISPYDLLAPTSETRIRRDRRLRSLFLHLSQIHPRNAPSSRDAARIAMCGEATLRRHLSRAGLHWRRFVADWRLQQATELRRQTDHPLREIAVEVGYSSASTLARALGRRKNEAADLAPGHGDAPVAL
jgi:AraC-like DNA-binding protein